jgi:CotH kinase protein
MRSRFRMLCYAVLALPGLVQSAHAQTPIQWLFDPRSALSIILEMSQTTWNQIAGEQPVGGPCAFAQSPTIDRYNWYQTDATLKTEGGTNMQHTYPQIGIKKKSFCGSLDSTKPSLTLNLDKTNNANTAPALAQLGTVHLSLENAKQSPDLFSACAAYYVFRTMGIPASMCSFAALYRRDGANPPVFLGIYVLTEAIKKDFFQRRPAIANVVNGSLYELEVPDDFTPVTVGQLQPNWSATANQDFLFAINQVQNLPTTALQKILDLPPFITFWASEIFLKDWDGYTNNRNNTCVCDGPQATQTITQTRFRFIPHGPDQVVGANTKPMLWANAITAQLALKDNGLRYQLIRTLATMGGQLLAMNIPGQIDTFVPLVVRLWRGQDPFFGADRNKTLEMAEHVRLASQQAIVDLRTVFGNALMTPPGNPAFRLVGPHHVECVARTAVAANLEPGHAAYANLPNQKWFFDPAPLSMTALGFPLPLSLYRVRNQGISGCLQADAQFTDGSQHFNLKLALCNAASIPQRFYLVQREGRSFELRSYAQNACVHFSDAILTSDGRPAIYLSECDGNSKNLIVME